MSAAAPNGGGGGGSGRATTTAVWDVNGQQTEVIELPVASGQQAEVQVLVIPGNPGAAPFYTPFMHSLQRHLGGRAAVATVSNLGMDGQGLTARGRVYSLEEQIEHKVEVIRRHYTGPGRPPLVLLGHSIGTYMAIHAVHRLERHHLASSRAAAAAIDSVAQQEWEAAAGRPAAVGASMEGMQAELVATRQQEQQQQKQQQEEQEEAVLAARRDSTGGSGGGSSGGSSSGGSNVVKIIGLYPFLQADPDCSKQRQLRRIAPHHALLARLAGGLGALPWGLRRWLVRRLARQLDPHALDTVVNVFTNAACVDNGLYMGMTEFETLAAPADWWLLHQLGRRFALFVAPNDTWFKQWKWDAMHREVPGVESYWVEGQTHAFCVSVAQSEDLAARVAPIVQAALGQPAPDAAASAATAASRL